MSVERLPWGTREQPKKLGYFIAGPRKQQLEEMVEAAGVSGAVFVERVIAHLYENKTNRGLPEWWPEQDAQDGELPIEAA
ncbi:hypothetical protein [Microbacterium sp. NPDC055665]